MKAEIAETIELREQLKSLLSSLGECSSGITGWILRNGAHFRSLLEDLHMSSEFYGEEACPLIPSIMNMVPSTAKKHSPNVTKYIHVKISDNFSKVALAERIDRVLDDEGKLQFHRFKPEVIPYDIGLHGDLQYFYYLACVVIPNGLWKVAGDFRTPFGELLKSILHQDEH